MATHVVLAGQVISDAGSIPAASTTFIVRNSLKTKKQKALRGLSCFWRDSGVTRSMLNWDMLRLVRRHQKPIYDQAGKLIRGCPLKSEADRNCPGKVKCPIHLKGVGPDGVPLRETLRTRNWSVASEMLLEREAGVKKEAPPVSVAEAIRSYRQLKEKRADDTKRKIGLLTDRLKVFLERRSFQRRRRETARSRRLSRRLDWCRYNPPPRPRNPQVVLLVLLPLRLYSKESGYPS